ncbi:cytochrome P450 12b2 [Glossina fuscipes fuscipes]
MLLRYIKNSVASHCVENVPLRFGQRQLSMGLLDMQKVLTREDIKSSSIAYAEQSDTEWSRALPYNSLPGPSRLRLIKEVLPGGKYYNVNMMELNRLLRETYGDIYLVKGLFGREDTVFTYNPHDFEIMFRNEGVWPYRVGLQTFNYYRKKKRPEVFHDIGGLVSEQGKAWGDIRSKVNPIMMKTQTIRENLPQIDVIAQEFTKRLESMRVIGDNHIKCNFLEEVQKWAFESISFIALNKRMGLFGDNPDQKALTLAHNMALFFQFSYEFDVKPSVWPYVHTPAFKEFLTVYDNITDITLSYIEQEISELQRRDNQEAKSVLEKLLKIDKHIALVMVMDMLMAGIDTTASTLISVLYMLATNPEKQLRLREEICELLPAPWSPLTSENTKNMPYLRACLKESLRIMPITPGNMRTTIKDLVLSGYQIPAGSNVLMGVMPLANTDKYFPKSEKFLPERWLKNEESTGLRSKNAFVYAPFGMGPRTCIGKRVAEMEIETLITRLIRNYHISWSGKEKLKYESNIITKPCGEIKFQFEPLR